MIFDCFDCNVVDNFDYFSFITFSEKSKNVEPYIEPYILKEKVSCLSLSSLDEVGNSLKHYEKTGCYLRGGSFFTLHTRPGAFGPGYETFSRCLTGV